MRRLVILPAFLVAGTLWFSLLGQAQAVILISAGGVYEQNFNSLAASGTSSDLPDGWSFVESGDRADNTYTADDGRSNTADTYSYGSDGDTDRALGSLTSGSITEIKFGAVFENAGEVPITSLRISYTGEQWREGDKVKDYLYFEYSLNASSLTDGTWTQVGSLTFESPQVGNIGKLDGNAAENQRDLVGVLTGFSLSKGDRIWIRWRDKNVSGCDAGMAVDDLRVEAAPEPAALGWVGIGMCGLLIFWRKRKKQKVEKKKE